MKLTVLILALAVCFACSVPAWASAQSGPDISYGIPTVTTQQAVAKADRVYAQVYDLVSAVSPGMTLIIVIAALFLSIFFKEAKKAIVFAGGALILVMWGPQIIGWFMQVLRS